MDDAVKLEILELAVRDLQNNGLSGDQTLDAADILWLCALARRGLEVDGKGTER